MPVNLTPIYQKQYLVTLMSPSNSLTVYFTRATVGQEEFDQVEYNDGLVTRTLTHIGYGKIGTVTLGKPFDPIKDTALYDWHKSEKSRTTTEGFSVSIQPIYTDTAGTRIESSVKIVLLGCQVVSFPISPDVDRMGTGLSMFEMEIIPRDYTYR